MDINGSASYTRVQLLAFDRALSEVKTGSNPADKFIQLFNLEASKKYSITLLSINGVVSKKEIVENKNTCIIETARLPAGAYVILIETAGKRIQKIVRLMRQDERWRSYLEKFSINLSLKNKTSLLERFYFLFYHLSHLSHYRELAYTQYRKSIRHQPDGFGLLFFQV